MQVVGLILVTGLLLISLSIGAALVVARQQADTDISVNVSALAQQMLSVRGVATTLAADLGMGPAQAAALAANDGSMCTALLGVCSTGLSGGILSVRLSYGQLLAVGDTRTMQPAAEGFQAQVQSPCMPMAIDGWKSGRCRYQHPCRRVGMGTCFDSAPP